MMHTLDAEDHTSAKPYKEGYLQKQINSIFDIWNTRYFYLDTTNFAYFNDENTDKPNQIIKLHDCIVDGIWRNGELHTFTIRSLTNDEVFYYLGAFSAAEAEEWIRNLRAAVKLLEIEKMAEEMSGLEKKPSNWLGTNENEGRYMEIPDRKITENERSNGRYYGEDIRNREEEDLWNYLTKPNKEVRMSLPPQLDIAYNEFKRLLKDTSTYYSVVKSENYVNIGLDEQDPKHRVYKCSFFINGDFNSLIKLLNNDYYETLWNLYLTNIKQTKKLAENCLVFDAQYELALHNLIFTFRSFYISQAWKKNNQFNLIRACLASASKNYKENLLTFDLPLEMLGLRVDKLECSYPKCRLTLIIKLRKRNFLLDKIIDKFIKKYMIAFSILRDELEELVEEYEKIKPCIERPETMKKVEIIKPENVVEDQPLIERRKRSSIQLSIEPKRALYPTILEPQTPEQHKALDEFSQRLQSQGIELSEKMTRRFLISKDYNVDDSETNVKNYIVFFSKWLDEMKFDTFKWDDPTLFGDYLNPRIISHIGFDRQNRPVVLIRLCNYFPSKTPEEHLRRHAFGFMMWLTKTQFKPGVEQYLIIADLTDANKDNISFSQCMTGVKNLMSFFPQYSYRMYIINGGFMVKMLYNAIKPILKERHKKKLVFCNSDDNEAYNLLKLEMEDDAIPVHLGGKFVDYK